MGAERYEEKLEDGEGSGIARRCLKEMKGRMEKGKGLSKWEREREGYWEGGEEGEDGRRGKREEKGREEERKRRGMWERE